MMQQQQQQLMDAAFYLFVVVLPVVDVALVMVVHLTHTDAEAAPPVAAAWKDASRRSLVCVLSGQAVFYAWLGHAMTVAGAVEVGRLCSVVATYWVVWILLVWQSAFSCAIGSLATTIVMVKTHQVIMGVLLDAMSSFVAPGHSVAGMWPIGPQAPPF
jgi:hypothetical protein